MKVFVAHEDPYNAGNPYIYTLMEGVNAQHPDVEFSWGTEIFWSDQIYEYDIVHFHWTQAYMAMDEAHHTSSDLFNRLLSLKDHNVKIVATCHDLEAHYNQCIEYSNCLDIVYKQCDAIFHMGKYSLELFLKQYPDALHLLLPHHLYNTVYTSFPTREESIDFLGLSPKRQYILCLGMFRAAEERNLVKRITPLFSRNNISVLAPAFIGVERKYHHGIIPTRQFLLKKYYRAIHHISCSGKTWVPVSDELIPYYYGVASIAFVHRLRILNSGNAVLPFLFGRVVVGPDMGNCGELLKGNGCPTFNVPRADNLKDAVMKGLDLSKDMYFSNQLKTSAIERYSTETISNKLYAYYRQLV